MSTTALVRVNDRISFKETINKIVQKLNDFILKQKINAATVKYKSGEAANYIKELGFVKILRNMCLRAKNEPGYAKQILRFLKDEMKRTVSSTFLKLYQWILVMLAASYEMESEIIANNSASNNSPAPTHTDSCSLKVKDYKTFKDCYCLLKQLVRIHDCLKKKEDARTRVSRTAKPSQWEIRYVLGIKPGVNYVASEWKAYRENGFVVVKHKTNGTEYRKPFSEIVEAANREAAQKANTANPDYVAGMYSGYGSGNYGNTSAGSDGYQSNDIPKQERGRVKTLILKITDLLKLLTGMVVAFKALKSAGPTLRSIRDFVANTVTYISKVIGIKKDLDQATA